MENHNSFYLKNVSFSYDQKEIIHDMTLTIPQGKIVTLLGSNGCGKSTLFGLLTKNLKPSHGEIYYRGTALSSMSLHDFAQRVAIVHQNNTAPADMTVEQLVSYGRVPFSKMGHPISKEKDTHMIERAMKITGITQLRNRTISALSGGQRQRVWIAMALAQGTGTLLLDEPTTYLDVRYQLQILRLVQQLNVRLNLSIIMVLHDINQAIAYSDEIIALSPTGTVVAQGAPQEIISSETLKKIYRIDLDIVNYQNQKIVLTV